MEIEKYKVIESHVESWLASVRYIDTNRYLEQYRVLIPEDVNQKYVYLRNIISKDRPLDINAIKENLNDLKKIKDRLFKKGHKEFSEQLQNFNSQIKEYCVNVDDEQYRHFQSIAKQKGWVDESDLERKREEEKKREENRRRLEDEKRRQEEQRRIDEEWKRLEELRRKEEQARLFREEQRRIYEQWKQEERSKGKKILPICTVIFVLLAIFLGYKYAYQPYSMDKKAPRHYTFTNLNLRSSKDTAASNKNVLTVLPYGTELITYSQDGTWAHVKAGKEKGFVSVSHILSPYDFQILNGAWGNTDAKECVPAARHRLALLDFYKRQNIRGGTQWQLYTQNVKKKQNNILHPKLYDKESSYSDFIFILKNNQTKARILAFYTFDDDTGVPIYLYSSTNVPKEGYITGATSYWGYNGLQINIAFSNGTHEKGTIVGQRPPSKKTTTAVKTVERQPRESQQPAAVAETSGNTTIRITSLSFKETDKEGNELRPQGTDIYTDFMYLSPIISYEVIQKGKPIEIWYKIYNPDNQLQVGTNSKPGFTWGHSIDRDKERMSWRMGGWGNPNRTGYNKAGNWRIEFYEGDICLLKKEFTVKQPGDHPTRKASIKITSVSFCETDKGGNVLRPQSNKVFTDFMFLSPYVTYEVIEKGKPVDIWYKIYDPYGILQTGNESKQGFTWHGLLERLNTQHKARLGGWGETDRSLYSATGQWRIEFYEENLCIYKQSFTVQKPTAR